MVMVPGPSVVSMVPVGRSDLAWIHHWDRRRGAQRWREL